MQVRVAAIRDASARGDRSAADDELSKLRVDVVQFRADDKINDSAAQRILARGRCRAKQNSSLLDPPDHDLDDDNLDEHDDTTTTQAAEGQGQGPREGERRGRRLELRDLRSGEERRVRGGRHRAREKEPLPVAASVLAQEVTLLRGLDPLGDRAEPEGRRRAA